MIIDTNTNVNIDSQINDYHIANYDTYKATMLFW